MKALKKFYDELYKKKMTPEYKKELEERRKDFLHKYLLFFLNPYKNTRHDVVKRLLPNGERLLDIGCWTGDSTLHYEPFEKFREVYGVEISEEAAIQARKKGIKVSICDINSDDIPFPDNYFDCITFMAVIEHLIDPYHIMAEIRRVLKNDGVLIIGTPNVASLSNRIRIFMGRRPRTSFDIGWDGGHLLYFTPSDLRDLLKEYGFKVVGKYPTGNLMWLRKILFNLTGEFIFLSRLEK